MDVTPDDKNKPVESSGSVRHDILASIVAFLVALPLCMGIAIASGVPTELVAAVGIITGIVGGIVVGSLGGSQLQVSGPAAGLTVIVFELIERFGWETLGVIVLLAGSMQLFAGLFRLGQWFRAVSPAVIHGMLAGIGVLIFASQFHIMVDDQPRSNGLQNLLSIPEAIVKGIVPSGNITHDDAARIGLLTISVIVLWRPLVPRWLKAVPATLAAVVLATALTAGLQLPIKQVQIPDKLLDAIQLPTWDLLEQLPPKWLELLVAAAGLAFIASAETLLCATAVDQMHKGPRTRYDRELAAQGVANIICGLLGALPMTGVIVRSAANVEAGARSRLSAILHGVWLLIFVVLLPSVLRLIPTAALAAVLVYTGYRLMNFKAIRSLWSYGKGEVFIYAATVILIVSKDLLTGVVVGILLSMIKLLYIFSHLTVRLEEEPEKGRTILYLEGAATFIRLPKLAATLEAVAPSTELHVHFDQLTYIDHACLELMINWERQHEATGGKLVVDWESLTACFKQLRTTGNLNNGSSQAKQKANEKSEITAASEQTAKSV